MNCERCSKTITEQTARIYSGRCVPCDRRRPMRRLGRFFREAWSIVVSIVSFPFDFVRGLPGLVRLWFTPLPFTRREIIQTLAPVHGKAAARLYFRGLRSGFLSAGDAPPMSGISIFYSMGLEDGFALRRDPSQWPAILQQRASSQREGEL